ncbi:MAG: hypothetical protein Q8K75_11665 [Chlamydiales bacterium]|nr:hypothetical protein [Chlamydiales bacterium]
MDQAAAHYINANLVVPYPADQDEPVIVRDFLNMPSENQTLLLDTFKIMSSGFGLAGYGDLKHTFKALRHGLKACQNINAGVVHHLRKIALDTTPAEDVTKSLNKVIGYVADPLCFVKSIVFLTHKSSSPAADLIKSLDGSIDALSDVKKPLCMGLEYTEIEKIYKVAMENKLAIAKHSTSILGIGLQLAGYPGPSLAFDSISYLCGIAEFIRAKGAKR